MSTFADIVSFLACLLCAGAFSVVALSAFLADGADEDGPPGLLLDWLGVVFAIVPAVCFGSTAVYIILNF